MYGKIWKAASAAELHIKQDFGFIPKKKSYEDPGFWEMVNAMNAAWV